MSDYDKVDVSGKRIQHVAKPSDRKIVPFKGQDYEALKSQCLKSKKLFEDPFFPPLDKSMYYTQPVPTGVKWRRPKEITKQPLFIANKVDANDLDQGYLGNCWFIAACSSITLDPDVFANVVPSPQSFDEPYAGIFHFHFWYYGQWVDVCIDDRLPCQADGRLLFCSNKQEPNEFWAALLEKAYAKLCGNYENLDGGNTTDALVDMTGGIQESFEIKEMRTEAMKNEIWQILVKSRMHKSLIGASIAPDPRIKEARLANGLVMGHAYTVTKVAALEQGNREIRLIRVRNPWGNEVEWRGSWSDNAYEWSAIPANVKTALEYRNLKDGEFWMGFDDFYRNFETVQFCDLTPDAFSSELLATRPESATANNKLTWKLTAYNGEWVKGKSSGGSGKSNEASFWQNPQFLITLTDVDPEDNENLSTVIISLLQKYTREKRTQNKGESCEEFIQFRLYRILADSDAQQAKQTGKRLYASQLERCGTSGPYINLREVTKRFRTAPGNYLIIPSCYDEGVSGEFLLRLYTENPISESNCTILHDHKDHLCNEDIFFKNSGNLDEAFSSWSNLLNGGSDHSKTASGPVSKRAVVNGGDEKEGEKSSSQKHHHHKAFVKEFKVYLDSHVMSMYEKIDVHRRIKHFKF